MLCMEINDGQFKLDIFHFHYGWNHRTNSIFLSVLFRKELPEIIKKFAESGTAMQNVRVYNPDLSDYKKYYPTYVQVIIESMKSTGFNCLVSMNALRAVYFDDCRKRVCLSPNCDIEISPLFVMINLMDELGLDAETAEAICSSEIVEFYCCFCFKVEK